MIEHPAHKPRPKAQTDSLYRWNEDFWRWEFWLDRPGLSMHPGWCISSTYFQKLFSENHMWGPTNTVMYEDTWAEPYAEKRV